MEIREEDLINVNERFVPKPKIKQPVDIIVSKLVGKTVLVNDPRLLRLVVRWKAARPKDETIPDNFLDDPKKAAKLQTLDELLDEL